MRTATALAAATCLAAQLAPLAPAQEYEAIIIEALDLPSAISEAYLFDVNEHGEAVGFMTYSWRDDRGIWHTEYFGCTWTEAGGVVVLEPGAYGAINNLGDVTSSGVVHLAGGGSCTSPAFPAHDR